MAIKVCETGHLFDDRYYTVCPECGRPDASSGGNQQGGQKVRKIVISRRADDTDVNRTVSYYSEFTGNNYVTGWLVCCEGANKGRDYRLFSGFNRIGTSADSEVCLTGDSLIGEKSHCAVVYDRKSNRFFVTPGRETLTYLNGELLKSSAGLKMNDILQLGSTKLEFIPYCGGTKSWD